MTIRDQIPPEHDYPVSATGFPIVVGLPPFHAKFVSRIENGEFIEMWDLLSDHLGTLRNEDQKFPNAKRRTVTNIREWSKCFCIHMAVVSRNNPEKIPEMLPYLTLIIEAHLVYAGDAWLY